MPNTDVPDAPGPDDDPELERAVERLLARVEAFLAERAEPVLTLLACRHTAMVVPGRYLCDACSALPYDALPVAVRRRLPR